MTIDGKVFEPTSGGFRKRLRLTAPAIGLFSRELTAAPRDLG